MRALIIKAGGPMLAITVALSSACATQHASSASSTSSPTPATSSTSAPPAATTYPGTAVPPPNQDLESKVQRVSAQELKKMVADKQAVVIDVRSADAYKVSHIKGSLSLPLGEIEAGNFKSLPRDKRIITYCSCPAENTSARASVLLEKAGFKNVGTLLGGTAAWEQSGGEMGGTKQPTSAH
jgi:rhodanese-related sulfurtransferase